MRQWRFWLVTAVLAAGACTRTPGGDAGDPPADPPPPPRVADAGGEAGAGADPADAGIPQFPAIPVIVVPEILGVGPAQRALEASIRPILDPVEGVSVSPARCDAGGELLADGGLAQVDAQGNLVRNGDEGIFRIAADGSGSANFEGGLVTVEADGSGTINGSAGGDGDGETAIIRVEADGSGSYNGPAGLITLDGKGGGTWNGDSGLVVNNGDGSGSWNGQLGLLRIEADGSGTWNGPHGLVVNNGDGTGTVGTPAREVRMPPLPRVPPAGRFPPLRKFAPPGAPCGYVITLNDRVLFDFDKSDIRPDASQVLDTLAAALARTPARGMEVRGHTDSKGKEGYNRKLSERRAASVKSWFVEHAEIDPTRIQTKGWGESKPAAANEKPDGSDDPQGRQLNRRVEITIKTG